MFYNRNIRHLNDIKLQNDLPSNNNISYDINDRDYLKGIDERPIQNPEPNIEIFIDLHDKNKRYDKLLSDNYSLLDKEQWALEYLNENNTMSINILAGGLMGDWNFEM